MIDKVLVGRNIKSVRKELGKTQREICAASNISPSQLSAYENGKQLPSLETLANIALALETSIDRLCFGSSSVSFLNRSISLGDTVVNCLMKLDELDLLCSVKNPTLTNHTEITLNSCGPQLVRLYTQLREYESHKDYYPDGHAFLEQIRKSIVNEINGLPPYLRL